MVEGDATELPFEDGSFDYVISVDVYEHIEPRSRERYLSELRRTARRGVLLAAPFDSEIVRAAEQVAIALHRSLHQSENVWLGEHAAHGLPRLGEARGFFEERGDSVSVLPNGYIPHWLAMICLTFYASKLGGESSGLFDDVTAFYNEFADHVDAVRLQREDRARLVQPRDAALGDGIFCSTRSRAASIMAREMSMPT